MIDAPDSTVFWSFQVAKHGIEFEAVFHPANGGESQVLQECQKFKANEDGVVTGQCTLTEPGCCVFCFNNKYSAATGKTIEYQFSVIGSEVGGNAEDGTYSFSYASKVDEADLGSTGNVILD